MKARNDGSEGFVMVYVEELLTKAVAALGDKLLQPRDLAVLTAVLANVCWRSGRANVTVRALAQQIQVPESNCAASVRRLQKERLVARMKDSTTGMTYLLINPRLASVGGPQRRGFLIQQFDDAFEDAAV